MADQLQEMLQRIYEEGVNKAKQEASEILEQAQKQAKQIKTDAQKEADKIISEAKQQAANLEKNVNSDLKMASQQAMTALKNKIIDAVILHTLAKPMADGLSEAGFMQKMILEILSKWSPQSALSITLPEQLKSQLDTHIQENIRKSFSGSLKVDYSPQMKNGLTISPADGSYKLNFTDEDFVNFFKSYLRPRTSQLLFGD